jgi:uncharacterized membrane protein YgcG
MKKINFYVLILSIILGCANHKKKEFIIDNENILEKNQEDFLRKQIRRLNKENNIAAYIVTTPYKDTKNNFDVFLMEKIRKEKISRIIIGVSKDKRKFSVITNDYITEKLSLINLDSIYTGAQPFLKKMDFFSALKLTIEAINKQLNKIT